MAKPNICFLVFVLLLCLDYVCDRLVVVVVAISAVATMSQKRWCVQIYFLFFYEPIIISFPDGLVIYKILQIDRERERLAFFHF